MHLHVNGLAQEIVYDRHVVEEILVPRLGRWIDESDDGGRHFAFLAAPPGTGKSTLGLLLERALAPRLECVGIDGFHRPAEELAARTMVDHTGAEVPMAARKGAPETFDVESLDAFLSASAATDLVCPVYDRARHDVVPGTQPVRAAHVLVEGNYLLLDEEPWSRLRRHAELTIFIQAPEPLLRERLVGRKIQGGVDRAAAEAFYESSDGPNVRLTLKNSSIAAADVLLTMGPDGLLTEGASA